jgi:glycosyltransferase involved in cell wall biosynthesis
VTERRAAFMPWLRWGFERQTWPRKELVIVDSSPDPMRAPEGEAVRVIAVPPGTNVPAKRNLALAAARGPVVAWFDDDDWQHPRRLAETVPAVAAGAAVASAGVAWFFDLLGDGAYGYRSPEGVIFNAAAFACDAARSIRFDEQKSKASDAGWLAGVLRVAGRAVHRLPGAVHTFWLCHRDNLSNGRDRLPLCFSQALVRRSVGEIAWAGTDEQLVGLRDRMGEVVTLQSSPRDLRRT